MTMPKPRIPVPEVMKFTIVVEPSLVIISIYLVYLLYAQEHRRRFLKKWCIYIIWPIWPHPITRTPAPWVMICTIFVEPSHYYILSLSALCPRVEEKIIKDCINFTVFTQNVRPLGVRVMKYTISCLFPLQMLHTKFEKDWPSGFWVYL